MEQGEQRVTTFNIDLLTLTEVAMNAAASVSAPALWLRKTLQPDHSSRYRCSQGDFMEMTAEQLVARIAAAFDVTAPPSDGAVIDNLIKSGVGDRQADVAVKLVQIACGRIFLDGLGIKFSDDYLCFDAHGKVVESGRLSQHPVFAAAMERMNSAPLAVKYLAVMSADVQTVNKMMQKGSDPSSLATGPSALFVEVPTEAGLATARQMISETLKTSRKAPTAGVTSAYPAQFLASIDARLRRDGVQTSLAEGVLTLSALNCRVRCELVQGDFHPQLVPLRVLVEHQAFGEPLEDQIAAVATTPDSAVGYATDLWVAAFFNPFHAFAHSGYEHQPLSMVTTSPSGEHLGWQVFTTSPFTNSDSAPTRMEMFKHLITPLNPKLLDRKAHALKCFVQKEPGPCRKAGDNVTASCHFDNREWLEGLSQLLYLGDSWGELSSTRLMRQWFFFRAATKAEIGDSWDKLTLAIQAPSPAKESKQKPWWKVW